jgi:hypothetical protein
MSCMAYLCLGTMMSAVGGVTPAHSYDQRVNPDAARRPEISIDFSTWPQRTLDADAKGELRADKARLPREYASAMTWYRVTLASGYLQPPMLAAPWGYDEELPKPLNWTWVSDGGDLMTRIGKGSFRLSLADNQNNWFREVDCQLAAWPGGNTEAPMNCNDGAQRMLRVPGGGTITIDDVVYTRVFQSELTNLPPEVSSEELLKKLEASGSIASAPQTGAIPTPPEAAEPAGVPTPATKPETPDTTASADAAVPERQGEPANVPLPKPRPDNPFY